MTQRKVKCNQDTESEDEQTGNQNHNIPYTSNANISQTRETENPSVYIELRNIGDLTMHVTNHLHKPILGMAILFASKCSWFCTSHPLLHTQHTKRCLFDRWGQTATLKLAIISSCFILLLHYPQSHDHICGNMEPVTCAWCSFVVIQLWLPPRTTHFQKCHLMHLYQAQGLLASEGSPCTSLMVIILALWVEDSLSLPLSKAFEPIMGCRSFTWQCIQSIRMFVG